jgi:isoleucyl-tRNA synthetase
LILSEVNVKELNFVTEKDSQLIKNLKLNFKTLGKKYGKQMKAIQTYAQNNSSFIISGIELNGKVELDLEGEKITLLAEDVEIIPVDLPGWKVANIGAITVALDITLTEQLKEEGIAREVVNRIQNLRKDKGFDVTDRIGVKIQENNKINAAITNNLEYICAEILASNFKLVKELGDNDASLVDITEDIQTTISISKTN